MRAPSKTLAVLTLVTAVSFATAAGPAIVQRWSPEDPTPKTFKKVTVVCITADRVIRHRIENKLVSHLRGRGLMAVASYTLVEDLAVPGDPEEILDRVLEQSIDGAITIRTFPLAKNEERPWIDSWLAPWDDDRPLRKFVADSLSISARKDDRYGLDFAVWYGGPAHAVWAGRTEVYPASRLRKDAAEVVQSVIDAFEEAELF